jgi:SpoVK/Ycf46/Vps4 family AAA+-type ATPase
MTTTAPTPFDGNNDHLRAELRWLESLLQAEILRARSSPEVGRHELFRGMYISDREVDRLLHDAPESDTRVAALHETARALRADIDARIAASLEEGVALALPHLSALFGLTDFETRVLLAAIAPEVDARFGTLFAYLQDDATRRRPSVDLAIRLFAAPAQRLETLAAFSHHATLPRLRLLNGFHASSDPLPHRPLALDALVVSALLGHAGLEQDLLACVNPVSPHRALAELRWDPDLRRRLLDMTATFGETAARSARRLVIHFHGPAGTGKRTLAAAVCRELGVPLVRIDLRAILTRFEDFEHTLFVLLRQALVERSAVFLDHFEAVTGDEDRSSERRKSISRAVDELAWLIFIGTEAAWTPGDLFRPNHAVSIGLPPPDLAERRRLWEAASAARTATGAPFAPDIDWREIAVKFRVTPGVMNAAIDAAEAAARLREPRGGSITAEDLHHGLYAQSNQKLGALAHKLVPRHAWSHIILPANALAQLRELCAHVRHRHTVLTDWGFAGTLSLGKGMCALFCGQSGVGKTMAVEVIANELALEVYKIDLSTVVSKYIGETEKNLSRVFHDAESSNAILFFDEADALFGKRSEVKDAHDRYANIEINYLLQRIEEFEGLVILASNLRKNIDDAFFRRMQFVIEFPFPDVAHRYGIWKQHFPADAPIAEDVDLAYLAERFTLSGGGIKNVVVNAAFLAAAEGRPIRMRHLIHATRREYEKAGRLCTENDFGAYHATLAS